jgi:biopolymer transport protein ExbB/TolQ
MALWRLFIEGGFIMYPLLICLLASVYVALDKVWLVFRLNKDLKVIAAAKSVQDMNGVHSALIAPFKAFEQHASLAFSERKDLATDETDVVSEALKGKLWILGSVASTSPFIGLFGTVVGIIKSFEDLASAGKGGFAVVAAGLSEALIATAAGIIVAVIAVLFFNYIKAKNAAFSFHYQKACEHYFNRFRA